MRLSLNGFEVTLSAATFTAHVLPFPDPNGLREFCTQHEPEWFLHWREGLLYGIPRVEAPTIGFGEARPLDWSDHQHLQVLTARLNDVLPTAFPRVRSPPPSALRVSQFEG